MRPHAHAHTQDHICAGTFSFAHRLELIEVDDPRSRISVHFTPTVPHCSAATLIGPSAGTALPGRQPVCASAGYSNAVHGTIAIRAVTSLGYPL